MDANCNIYRLKDKCKIFEKLSFEEREGFSCNKFKAMDLEDAIMAHKECCSNYMISTKGCEKYFL